MCLYCMCLVLGKLVLVMKHVVTCMVLAVQYKNTNNKQSQKISRFWMAPSGEISSLIMVHLTYILATKTAWQKWFHRTKNKVKKKKKVKMKWRHEDVCLCVLFRLWESDSQLAHWFDMMHVFVGVYWCVCVCMCACFRVWNWFYLLFWHMWWLHYLVFEFSFLAHCVRASHCLFLVTVFYLWIHMID